jgi:DNA-binding CsgD family transcriptional regulator
MARLRHSNIRALSEALLKLYSPVPLSELPNQLLRVISQFLKCDLYSYNEHIGLTNERMETYPDYPDKAKFKLFAEYLPQHPMACAILEQQIATAVTISDFATRTQWEKTDLYNSVFRGDHLDYQLGFITIHETPQMGLALNRSGGDFTEEERQMLDILLPHLSLAYQSSKRLTEFETALDAVDQGVLLTSRNGSIRFLSSKAQTLLEKYYGKKAALQLPDEIRRWLLRSLVHFDNQSNLGKALRPFSRAQENARLTLELVNQRDRDELRIVLSESADQYDTQRLQKLGLSPKESDVLLWIARGKSNQDISVILGISTSTVCKHVEKILAKLKVENRTAAANTAWEFLR